MSQRGKAPLGNPSPVPMTRYQKGQGNFSKIDRRIHSDAKFRALTPPKPCGQSLFIHLLIAPQSTSIPGLLSISEAGLADELGWSMRGFRKAWREIESLNLAKADWKARLVWLPNALKYNEPQGLNVVKSWKKHWDLLPECELKLAAYEYFDAFLSVYSVSFHSVFRKACCKPCVMPCSKPSAIQEKEKEKKQHHPPHSTELDSSSGDAPTTEPVGGDGDGFDLREGGVELVGRGETEANPGVDIPTVEAATEAVELVEAELAQQPSEAHSEPTPAEEPHQVEETPQEPEEATTEATARAMVAALSITIPDEPIEDDDQKQSHNGCSVVERKWAVGRDLDDLPDHEALTTLDVDKALRSAGYIRGAMGTHAWGKLGKLHEVSPLTAGELRSALRLAQDPKVGAHLPYMAGCVERRRQGLVTPPSTRPQSPTSVTVPRRVEAIHEYHERCKQAHLREQMDAGLPPDEERADRAAFSGMPTDEDRKRYHGANGRWENIDDREAKAMAECMASVMAH